ncbi:MAG TPA: hypothetical protein VGQ76_24720, partial [Thermoanaerobaculia bacterium]|nr:hypothetical protein [Thermoanaerobaculia bacterium]
YVTPPVNKKMDDRAVVHFFVYRRGDVSVTLCDTPGGPIRHHQQSREVLNGRAIFVRDPDIQFQLPPKELGVL